jgi:hypothetical protein
MLLAAGYVPVKIAVLLVEGKVNVMSFDCWAKAYAILSCAEESLGIGITY